MSATGASGDQKVDVLFFVCFRVKIGMDIMAL